MRTNYLSRREEIVLTTINLIHELGVSNVSMKEISKREGVTDASLYKHFRSKSEILSAVLEYYEQYDEYIRNTLQLDSAYSTQKIIKYFLVYSNYFNNYKEITALMFSYEVLTHDTHFNEVEKCRRMKQVHFLTTLIEEGQKEGKIKTDFDPVALTYVLIGSFEYTILMWRLNNYVFELPDKVNTTITYALNAYLCEDSI